MSRKIIKTSDSSDTVFDEELNEIFHSTHGALTESKHVFIKNGFEYISQTLNQINILEIGFGTGLNTYLTIIESQLKNINVNYHSIEAFPLDIDIWNYLNYKNVTDKKYHYIFDLIHVSEWNKNIKIVDSFTLKKIHEKLQHYSPEINFDLIYFDAFSPDKQPDLWTYDIFLKLYNSLNNQGILVTYCAKGEVKRNLQKAGFIVEKLEGPPGKREMIRAKKVMKVI